MPRFPTSLVLLGAFLAAYALPLARADCCFASAVTSSYAPACYDCTAPQGLLSTCGVSSCNMFGCGCAGGCRTGCQTGTATGQPTLMCANDQPDGICADAAAAAPAVEGTEVRRRRLKQSQDATATDVLATGDSATASEDVPMNEGDTELLEVTGEAADNSTSATTVVMPPCRPPTSATEPADIFFYFLCLDTDMDGFITFEEACTNGLPGCANALDAGDNSTLANLRTQFLALDANADGLVSPAEFDAELAGYLPYGNSTEAAAPSPAVEPVPSPVPVTPATATSAGSRSRLFATGAAVVTALLAFINA